VILRVNKEEEQERELQGVHIGGIGRRACYFGCAGGFGCAKVYC